MACTNCTSQAHHGRTSCLFCGATIRVGREPTPEERHRTSEEFRQELLDRRIQARQRHDPVVINSRVLSAIQSNLKPLAEFTHTDLVPLTNLNACAVLHALHRLAEQRLVARVGVVMVRSNRAHDRWQVLAQTKHYRSGGVQGKSRAIRVPVG